MVAIVLSTGETIHVADEAITLVAGPYPHDVAAYTYIHGFGPGVLVTLEPAAAFVSRLKLAKPLAPFLRPNATPVWIKADAVTVIRPPVSTEIPDPPGVVKAVVMIAALHQSVQQNVDQALEIIQHYGGHI